MTSLARLLYETADGYSDRNLDDRDQKLQSERAEEYIKQLEEHMNAGEGIFVKPEYHRAVERMLSFLKGEVEQA